MVRFYSDLIKKNVLQEQSDPELGLRFVCSDGWEKEGDSESKVFVFQYSGEFYAVVDYRDSSGLESDGWDDWIYVPRVEKKRGTNEWVVVKDD